MKRDIDYLFIIRGLAYNTKNGAVNKQIYHIADYLITCGYKISILSLTNPLKDFDEIYNTHLSHKLSIKFKLIYYIHNNIIFGTILKFFLKFIFNDRIKRVKVYSNINILKKLNIKNVITPYWWGVLFSSNYLNKNNIYYIIYHNYESSNAISSEFESCTSNIELVRDYILKSYNLGNKIAGSSNISSKFTNEKIPILREGIDKSKYDAKISPEEKKDFIIIMPLRAQKMKGAIYALRAAILIHGKYKDIYFESFGDYKGDIPPFIIHHGLISTKKLIKLYGKGKIFILPSLEEGLSEVLLEAMLNGNAVISTNAGDSKYIIKNFYNGILVPIKDEISIFNAVSYLYTHNDILLKLANNGISTAKAYDYRIMVRDISSALQYYKNSVNKSDY